MSEFKSASDNWESMTIQERAVAVAHDVQYLIHAHKIEAESGTYLEAEVRKDDYDDDDHWDDEEDEDEVWC